MSQEKRMVKFDHNCSPYLAGERASFGKVEASKLVAKGIAHYWNEGEENASLLVTEVEETETDETELEGGEDGEGETDGDESGDDDVDDTRGEAEAATGAAKPKKARKKRRVRAE